jgi:hypothetical protein
MMTFKEFAEQKNKTTQSWYKPDFNQEKNELVRQSNALNISKKDIFEAFQNGKLQSLSQIVWSKLDNTNSNDKNLNWKLINSWKDKAVNDIKTAIEKNIPLPAPIVLKYKNNYYCVAGNTRLSISKLLDVTPKVWMIEV